MASEQDKEFIKQLFASVDRRRADSLDVPTYIKQYREFISALEVPKNAPPLPEVGEYHEGVELRPGLRADVVVPPRPGSHPILILLHGNGLAWGSAKSHRKFGMDFAHNGYLTINLDYRLAPENQFPAAFEDSLFAASWAVYNAHSWNGDKSRLAIAGISLGASLAGATALALHADPKAPKLRAVLLLEGVYDWEGQGNRRGERSKMLQKAYLGENYPALLRDPRVSPFHGVKPGALPPTLVLASTGDEIADVESVLMGSALRQAGITYELHMIEGMPHDFLRLTQLSGCAEGQRAMYDFMKRYI